MFTETLTWQELPADGLPDSDTTVLVMIEGEVEPATGFHDGENWRDAGSALRFAEPVLRWAAMPSGERYTHDEDQHEQGDARKHGPQPGALAAAVGTDEFRRGYREGMRAAADEVATHWNDSGSMSNTRVQAQRSADVLRALSQKEPRR